MGVGASVHILTIFYQRLAAGEAKEEAIASALGHSGLAVLMTSLTTAGALFSFTFATMAHVKNLGILAPLGVLFAFVYTVTVLPALLALLPIRANPRRQARLATLDRVLMGCAKRRAQGGRAEQDHPGAGADERTVEGRRGVVNDGRGKRGQRG